MSSSIDVKKELKSLEFSILLKEADQERKNSTKAVKPKSKNINKKTNKK